MTPDEFRRLALTMPGATETPYTGSLAFRVSGKIFATLGYPDEAWGIVRLSLAEQETLLAAKPGVFRVVPGEWSHTGSTNVSLTSVDSATLQAALRLAWQARAPRRFAGHALGPAGGKGGEAVVTPDEFGRLACELPEVTALACTGVREFRAGGTVFATLGDPDEGCGMVKLVWHQQEKRMRPAMFRPVPGAWGRRGHTHVMLDAADEPALREALHLAWEVNAPRSLVAWRRRDL